MKNEPKCPFCSKELDDYSKMRHSGMFRGTCLSCDMVIWSQDKTQYDARMQSYMARRKNRPFKKGGWGSPFAIPESSVKDEKEEGFNPSSRTK